MATVRRYTLCLVGVNSPRLVTFTVKAYLCHVVIIIVIIRQVSSSSAVKLFSTFISLGNSRGRTLPPVAIFADVEEMGEEGKPSIALRGPR